MWCRLAWLLVLAVLWAGGRMASAQPLLQPSLEQQLLHWQQLQSATSYHGSFVYERTGVFSTHEVWRKALGNSRHRERFLRLNGSRLEAVRENGQLVCMARSGDDPVPAAWQESASQLQRLELKHLAGGYEGKYLGPGRVAGREAMAVLFAPRDAHRYPLEIHFDRDTGVVLKSMLLNEQGELLERFQFVTFTTGPLDDRQLQVNDCQPLAVLESGAVDGPGWQAGWIPPGFAPSATGPLRSDGVSSQLFFDGLAHFSVFVSRQDGEVNAMEHRQLGPTVVISRPLEDRGQEYRVTVLGEIPVATAQRIALSISLDPGIQPHD
ncbi:MAG: RNA polymerase subunit sigma [Gammaproteobacteria bacterium]|nr:RNA polymerase subunit sigma [Gammaproteobacteria bacterium]